MSDNTGPTDTWEVAKKDTPPSAPAVPPPAATPEPKAKRKRKPKPVTGALPKDAKAEAVSQDIALAIDGITEQISGIQTGLVRKVTHMSVDAEAWTHALGDVVRKVFSVPLTILLQVFLVPLRFFNGLLGRVTPEAVDDDEEEVDWDAEGEEEDDTPEIKLVDFNDLLEKNIIFLDNSKRPIFSATNAGIGGRFGKQVMELYMELCLGAIRECAPLTSGMPPVEKGRNNGRKLEDLMAEVSADHVLRFFTFSSKFAASYSGKNFRLSETFATWLMNGSPIE